MSPQPLKNRSILITRDVQQTKSLKNKLEALGATVYSVPTISISEPPDWKPFDQALQQFRSFEWLLFSSANGVHQTLRRFQEYFPSLLPLLKIIKIAAIGQQTAQVIQDYLLPVSFVPKAFQSDFFVEEFLSRKDTENTRIFFPRALKGRDIIIRELEKKGTEVIFAPVYQTKVAFENQEKLRRILTRKPDWVVFTSSSTARNFFQLLEGEMNRYRIPSIASIGQITTKTIREYSFVPVFTANPQTTDGILQGLIQSCNS